MPTRNITVTLPRDPDAALEIKKDIRRWFADRGMPLHEHLQFKAGNGVGFTFGDDRLALEFKLRFG